MIYLLKHSPSGVVCEQLVVSFSFRNTVNNLAHVHLLGGYLGVKEKQRVLQRFYWPGVNEDVKLYFISCPQYQLVSPKPHSKVLLMPMPLINVPFERGYGRST